MDAYSGEELVINVIVHIHNILALHFSYFHSPFSFLTLLYSKLLLSTKQGKIAYCTIMLFHEQTRKPYTITKQRERWTEEEHNRFLEALKFYGRAWQRIEEYIGTKTAVQIRSHAQKFFTKLEKEALVKGVRVGQALDIEIPPPRPKRKPSNPYPRKTSAGDPIPHMVAKDGKKLASGSSSRPSKHLLDLEKEPLPEKPGSDEKLEDAKENHDEVNFEVFTLFQGTTSTSLCPENKKYLPTVGPSKNSCTFREFVPILNEMINAEETKEAHVAANCEGNRKLDKTKCRQSLQDAGICIGSNTGNSQSSQGKLIQEEESENVNEPKNFGLLSTNTTLANQNYPRHVPVHILDGNEGMDIQNTSDISCQESIFQKTGGIHGQPNQFANPVPSTITEHNGSPARSSIHQSFPVFHPLLSPTHNNQDDYRSFFHTSSTFSSFLVSSLLQNPAAHAAANFAAMFWRLANVETSVDSPAGALGGFSSRQISSAPSMEALAAATVAAATAWWAAHGLLPLCAPFHSDFTCTQSAIATPVDNRKTSAASDGRRECSPDPVPKDQQLEAEYAEALQEQHSASKAPTLSDSEASEGAKLNTGLLGNNNEQATAVTEVNDLNKTKIKKPVDRSSCGSNTPSSSEVETDALDKLENGKEESKEPDITPSGDTSNRRGRSSSSSIDSWKEVSEEGRLAFQALFSREVLPQSFSPPHDMKNKANQKINTETTKQSDDLKAENSSQLDVNGKTWRTSSQGTGNNASMRYENSGYGSILTMGPGHVKLKARRTGFKPYKRCSMEAKESRMVSANIQDEEKGPKRIRLEGEAST